MNRTEFLIFLEEEVKKYRGIYMPTRSSFFERLLTKTCPCKTLHPNPHDEFCQKGVGPNFEIISQYEEKIRFNREYNRKIFDEALIIEKIRPDGYMLLNGHHRWGAAILSRVEKVPVKIVNLTHEMDVKQMLWNSKKVKRAALDLDEVVFALDDSTPAEKGLPPLIRKKYPQRLRLGIPALFRFLTLNGYDIWVYSEKYYSLDDIKTLFKLYNVQVTGIVTGNDGKQASHGHDGESIEKMITSHYESTIAIDNKAVLYVNHKTKAFEEYELSGSDAEWSAEVMDKIRSFDKNEEQIN